MTNRLYEKRAGIAILVALIVISVAEVIFRFVAVKDFALKTPNLGEQITVIILAVSALVLLLKGKKY